MPKINEINTAVYRLLKSDETLSELCMIYKGAIRPTKLRTPSVTIETKRLESKGGEGIWMCDVVVTTYVDVLLNRMPDHEKLEEISSRVRELLKDSEIELDNAKAFPLIDGESSGPEWDSVHNSEVMQESIFGLIFVAFD